MSLSRRQLAVIHVAKTKLNIDDPNYRAALVQIGGVTSSKDLDQDGFDVIMGYFEYLGLAPLTTKGPDYGNRPGMASFAQLEFIRTLWAEHTRYQADEDALNKWLLRCWKVSSLRFLTKSQAQKAITALSAMRARAG